MPADKRSRKLATRSHKRNALDSYFELVKRFPLVPIRDETQFIEAEQMIHGLLQFRLDKGGQDYLEVLTNLVEDYDARHYPVEDVSEADVLRELMRANGLSQTKLQKAVGISQSTISDVLNGRRSLTREQIVALARYFNVSPAAFLPA